MFRFTRPARVIAGVCLITLLAVLGWHGVMEYRSSVISVVPPVQAEQPDTASALAQLAGPSSLPTPVQTVVELKTTDARTATLRVELLTNSTRVWKFLGGDPAGLSLAEQVQRMPVPNAVRSEWTNQIRSVAPDTVTLVSTTERPLVLDGITFGGRTSNTFKVWGRTICDWHDRNTGARINSTLALRWPAVSNGDEEFTLLQVLACTNGGFLRRGPQQVSTPGAPQQVSTPPAAPVSVPPTEEQPPSRPRVAEPMPVIPYEEPEPAHLTVNGTIWMTTEYVDGQNGGDHFNGFIGTETVFRQSYSSHNLGLVTRVGGGALGAPNANGEFSTGGGYLRLGVRRPMFEPLAWQLNLEGGGYADAQQLLWRDEQMVSPTHLRWEERRSTVGDIGGYARALGYGPQGISWDARAATGKRLRSEVEAEASVAPGPLVVKGAYRRSQYRDREVESHDREFTFPESRFRTQEASLGVRPLPNHRLSVGWKDWKFQSPTWRFDWQGPFVEYDWKVNLPWRVRADITRFTDTREVDPRADKTFENDHTRFSVGVNYDY